jgi:hypothetical protein
MTTTTKTLYINFHKGNITCFEHAGHTLKTSIEMREGRSEWFDGIDGDYHIASDFHYKEFADCGMTLDCETCAK